MATPGVTYTFEYNTGNEYLYAGLAWYIYGCLGLATGNPIQILTCTA